MVEFVIRKPMMDVYPIKPQPKRQSWTKPVNNTMETLCCNSCGAPLDVPEGTNYLKCIHCGQQLAVRRTESAVFTEAVEQLSETTEALSEQVEELARQNKLAALDRLWEQQRDDYMTTDKHGRSHLPDENNTVIGGTVIVMFGIFWTIMAVSITSSAPNFGPFAVARFLFPAFGILFVIGGIAASIRNYQKAQDYKTARDRYENERSQILEEE